MRISFMGHACFLLETDKGTKMITDPYQPGCYHGALKYAPVNIDADIVTVSHKHPDHNFTQDFPRAKILSSAGSWKVNDVRIEGIISYHDNQKGSARGVNIIFAFILEGLRIVHFGDLGTTDIDYRAIGSVDVALMPVGTIFTVDRDEIEYLRKKINPKIFIPMHFRTAHCEFKIATVEDFIAGKQEVQRSNKLDISSQGMGEFKKIVVLDYLR